MEWKLKLAAETVGTTDHTDWSQSAMVELSVAILFVQRIHSGQPASESPQTKESRGKLRLVMSKSL